MPNQVQLDAAEAMQVAKLFAEIDGRIEGFRLGLEVCKSLLVQQMIKARPPEPPKP